MRGLPKVWAHVGPALFSLLLLGTVFVSRRAMAVYECGGVQDTCNCGRDNFCYCCSNAALGDNHGNCVWYAWHKACCVWSRALEWCTDAKTWDSYATNNGYPLCDDPKQNTIFQCEANTSQCGSGGYGHVGWVETAYANGSIDVTEEGCYSWYGVRPRHIEAQNASPPMHYIYDKGDSCGQSCECNPGEEDSDGCARCGTRTRTCGSDCRWGSWSSCQDQGECEEGDSDQQSCPMCGIQSRTCGSDCQWGSWSACENQGECEAGTTEGCGNCGGTRTCDNDCHWGTCQELCPDGGQTLDSGLLLDGTVPLRDGAGQGDSAQAGDGALAQDSSSETGDAGGRVPLSEVRGGCQCETGANAPSFSVWLGLVALAFVLRRRKRRW